MSAMMRLTAPDLQALEQRSWAALVTAVAAFNYLEDTALAAEAHMHAHTIGELVARVFGCRAELKDGRWLDVCPLSLMHLRAGNSVGFVARRDCSVCDRDLSDCEHLAEAAYPMVAARRPDDECTVCGSGVCPSHVPGTVYNVVPHAVVREIDRLDEISIVARPRTRSPG
jgi:ferredoxin